jgi:myo-inositol-1(or 4)-monophosphatase
LDNEPLRFKMLFQNAIIGMAEGIMRDTKQLGERYFVLLDDVLEIATAASGLLEHAISKISLGKNPSTNIDERVDSFLKQQLTKLLSVPIISEESFSWKVRSLCPETGQDIAWIIDPIDGTLNMICGSPDVAISVALTNSNYEGILGVVVLPFHNLRYWAAVGFGAFKNGIIMNKNNRRFTPKIVSIGIPGDAKQLAPIVGKQVQAFIKSEWTIRQSGSAALDICRVADHTWRAFFEDGLYVWDVAAADVIAREAGCVVELQRRQGRTKAKQQTICYLAAVDEMNRQEVRTMTAIQRE